MAPPTKSPELREIPGSTEPSEALWILEPMRHAATMTFREILGPEAESIAGQQGPMLETYMCVYIYIHIHVQMLTSMTSIYAYTVYQYTFLHLHLHLHLQHAPVLIYTYHPIYLYMNTHIHIHECTFTYS